MCSYDLHSAQQYTGISEAMQTLYLSECILCANTRLASDDSTIGRHGDRWSVR